MDGITAVMDEVDLAFQRGDEPVVVRQGGEGGLVELHRGGAYAAQKGPLGVGRTPGPNEELRGGAAGPAGRDVVFRGQAGEGHFTIPRIFS